MKKRTMLIVVLVLMIALVAAVPAMAAPPCNDTGGDGSPSGNEYAQHHIKPLAQGGNLGAEPSGHAHTPGSHQGFSACNPSG